MNNIIWVGAPDRALILKMPAYMLFAVENYDNSNSVSIDSAIYMLDRGKEGFGGDDSILSIK